MSNDLIREIEQEYLKQDLPKIYPGDTVKVRVWIREGKRKRVQAYEGVVIKKSGSSTSATVTVRRVFQGVGVERTFLLHSPSIEGFDILRRGDVRRAKLYYMRNLTGKAARIREKTTGVVTKEVRPSKNKKS